MNWEVATVLDLAEETHQTRSITLDVPDWRGHRAGQHVDVRLTAEGGYHTQRSYSIASAPEDQHIVLTVERLEDGEVSSYLVDELRTGDDLQVRGPVGGYFAWDDSLSGPLLLVADGSGVVPLRSMLRHHFATMSAASIRLLYSANSLDDVIYRDELMYDAARDGIDVSITLTRRQPSGWRGYRRQVDRALLEEVAWAPDERPMVYICGPTAFVDTTASTLVGLGHDPSRIRAERFGGTDHGRTRR